MRSAPSLACEIDANLEPLDTTTEPVERYKHMPSGHLDRVLAGKQKSNKKNSSSHRPTTNNKTLTLQRKRRG